MLRYQISELFDISKTIAKPLLQKAKYPWEVLPNIADYILKLGESLSTEEYVEVEENVWVAKTATVAKTACLTGPCIIDSEAEVRHGAYIRGNAIIGKGAVVGNSTELKNCILFDKVQVPHFNYVGDSILGYKAHMGAGVITANVKSDKTNIIVKVENEAVDTGRVKVGAMLGDNVEVGCNSVLCPGVVIGQNSTVYPTSLVRGIIPKNSIYKKVGEVVQKV